MNVTLSVVFSGLAIIFGLLHLFKYKESKVVTLLFYLSLFGSGVSRIVSSLSEGVSPSWVDIGVAVVFGLGAILLIQLMVRERRGRD